MAQQTRRKVADPFTREQIAVPERTGPVRKPKGTVEYNEGHSGRKPGRKRTHPCHGRLAHVAEPRTRARTRPTRMDSQGTDRGAHLFSATPAWVCSTLLEGTASLRTDEDLRRMQSATAWRMRACPCIVTGAVRDPAVSKGAGILSRDSLIP